MIITSVLPKVKKKLPPGAEQGIKSPGRACPGQKCGAGHRLCKAYSGAFMLSTMLMALSFRYITALTSRLNRMVSKADQTKLSG